MSTFESDRPRPRPTASSLPGDPVPEPPAAPPDPPAAPPAPPEGPPEGHTATFVDPEPAPDTATRLLPRHPMPDSAVVKAVVLSAVALTVALMVTWLGIRRLLSRARRHPTSD